MYDLRWQGGSTKKLSAICLVAAKRAKPLVAEAFTRQRQRQMWYEMRAGRILTERIRINSQGLRILENTI